LKTENSVKRSLYGKSPCSETACCGNFSQIALISNLHKSDPEKRMATLGNTKEEYTEAYRKTHGRVEHGLEE
jgi:hypothetical protein